jgi:OmpA-OmpF porin, OOP family
VVIETQNWVIFTSGRSGAEAVVRRSWHRVGAGIVSALLVVVLAPVARAQSAAGQPTAAEIVERLRVAPAPRHEVEFRGVRVEHSQGAPAPPARPSVDLAVNFEFGSARLRPDAELLLDRLAAALADPALARQHFLVAGHTDAVGGDAFNQQLSEQRAAAVLDYLVRRHAVDRARLETRGYGRTRLLDPQNPASEINRRVQVTNLSAP